MRILFIVNTVFELYYLSAVAHLLKEARPDVFMRLVVRPRTAPALNAELSSLYSDIQELEITYLSGRPDWDFINSLRFRRRLAALDLDADIVCISSFREYFANILCRHLPADTRMVAFRMCDHFPDDGTYVKRPLRSMYNNLFNRVFGASTMEYRWLVADSMFGSKWPVHDLYSRTICVSDWGGPNDLDHIRLPPPHGSLRKLYEADGQNTRRDAKPAIIVAGERTPMFEGWNDTDQAMYESIFGFLRDRFSDHRLLFKARPGFTDISQVPLEGFEMVPPDIPFEELCLRHDFSKVVSVRSTTSKIAAYCGLPAYLLYLMFDLPESVTDFLDQEFGDMGSVVRATQLEDLYREPDWPQQPADLPSVYWEAVTGKELVRQS